MNTFVVKTNFVMIMSTYKTKYGGNRMNYQIREIKKREYPLLKYFLYQAIFIPEGAAAMPENILDTPEMQVYLENFGQYENDNCLVAELEGEIVGAVWTRIMKDYGHVDSQTPSFAISISNGYRGLGIGTALMTAMLTLLENQGFKKASLAVQKANYAAKMYQKLGFEIIDENEEEYIMIKVLDDKF